MPDYVRLAATAQRLITKAGIPITLGRKSAGDYNPAEGEVLDPAVKSAAGVAMRDQFRLAETDGERIRTGDVSLYVSISGVAPAPGDSITMLGESWLVVDCKPLQPGAIVLLYEVQARKP